MGKHRKWFWISGLYDNKRDILLKGKWDPLYAHTHTLNYGTLQKLGCGLWTGPWTGLWMGFILKS